ncbi:probable serine/threonine-protein kinase PBL11 [Rutidosis leptorrhynchoides]|uniref:probable serine/threonine-protein kinase PBL11 n=1 Tax=Rutidosis leptorrhynchoides TaxID=125765 RepID=UPI003A996754
MILAYEFMPNGNLQDHLHKLGTDLSWLQRLRICIGAARGLDYLHTGPSTQHGVIHRDVKTSNILLDANFAAKISDFGLAKIGPINQTQTFVSTIVKGTFGYMDPSYFFSGKLTRKSDVYAFGVVLFEVLSGKQAVDPSIDEEQWSLAVWAEDQIKDGKLNKIIDPRLIGQISKKSLKEFASIAGQCLHNHPNQRPTMAEIVFKLDSILLHERNTTNSVGDEVSFINRIRNIFTDKAELMTVAEGGSKNEICAENVQKSDDQSPRVFKYTELVSATNNFTHKLTETTYEGWMDENTYAPTKYGVGLTMNVRKKHIHGTSQLLIKPNEFNHPNLVKFVGYCLDEQEIYLVYELKGARSLDGLLFRQQDESSLSWDARLKIAAGAAQGLCFLHQRNQPAYVQFKTSHILVDSENNARLSDYEVENSFDTIGLHDLGRYTTLYTAPERFLYQRLMLDGYSTQSHLVKNVFVKNSEIYSFGVVLLEILTGLEAFDVRRPYKKWNLVEWAIPLLLDVKKLRMIMDPQILGNNHPPKGALKLAVLISYCLQHDQENRPSMEEISQVLHKLHLEETKTVDS